MEKIKLTNKKIIIIISSIAAIIIILLFFYPSSSTQDNGAISKKTADIKLINGDWLRTDGSYLIKITKSNKDGILEAEYFNPNPIRVESANWEDNYGNLRITIVLRDVNYPGSKYTLDYLPDRDILAGEYYQAVQGLKFYVEFIRKK